MLQQYFPKSGKSKDIVIGLGVFGIEYPSNSFSIVQPDSHGGWWCLQNAVGWNTVDIPKKHPTVVFGSKPLTVYRNDVITTRCFDEFPEKTDPHPNTHRYGDPKNPGY